MEPSNQTFKALMGNGIQYNVPRFQRDYSWSQEQWEDLWEDIDNLHEEEHYMGYIVLQREENNKNNFSIIDGQQRMITLSLLVLAAMKKINDLITKDREKEDNASRLNEIRRNFIGTLSPVTLIPYNKIILNRNNNSKFKHISEFLEPLLKRNLTKTDELMSDCFEFFYKKIRQDSGETIAEFIEKTTDSMLFTKIVVDDSLNAYKVFETLNARGVQLSTPDLLKNYLFSQVADNQTLDDNDLEAMDDKWSTIISELGERNFTDFIRYYHNTRHPLVTKKKLFKNIRDTITQVKDTRNYLNNLSKYAPIYAALNNPNDPLWQRPDYKAIQPYLEAFKLFTIKQAFLLLLAAYPQFTAEEFITLAKYLYILSIRYNIIAHYSPKEQERVYNTLAMKISSGTLTRASHIKNQAEFKKLYPNDRTFKDIFKYHTMSGSQNNKKIRYLLTQIENHLSNTNTDYNTWTLEHIIPYNITAEWTKYYDGQYNQEIDRLGNMTLVTAQENKDCGVRLFDEKKIIYKKSNATLSNKLSEYEQWDSNTLERHQDWLAEQAIEMWGIHFE